MSQIFIGSISEAQSRNRPEAATQLDLTVLEDTDKLEWYGKRKKINSTPLRSVKNYDGLENTRPLTEDQRFINNSLKMAVLENSINYIHPLTYWFKVETLIHMGAMQLMRIISGYTDLDYLNHLLGANPGIFKFMKEPAELGFLVYRYSLKQKTKIPEALEKSIYLALLENLMFYMNQDIEVDSQDPNQELPIYPEVTLETMEAMGYYSQLNQPNDINQRDHIIEDPQRGRRQEINPPSSHFLCAKCGLNAQTTKQIHIHIKNDHSKTPYNCHSRSICGQKTYHNYNQFMIHKMTFCRSIYDNSVHSDKKCLYCDQIQPNCVCGKLFKTLIQETLELAKESTFMEVKDTNLLPVLIQQLWDSNDKDIEWGQEDLIPADETEETPVEIAHHVSVITLDEQYNQSIRYKEDEVHITDLKKLINDRLKTMEDYLHKIEIIGQALSQTKACIFHKQCDLPDTIKVKDHFRNSHYACPVSLQISNNEPPVLRNDIEFLEHLYKHHLSTTLHQDDVMICDYKRENEQCENTFALNKYDSSTIIFHFMQHYQECHADDRAYSCKQCPSWTYNTLMGVTIHTVSWHHIPIENMWPTLNIRIYPSRNIQGISPDWIGKPIDPLTLESDPNVDKRYLGFYEASYQEVSDMNADNDDHGNDGNESIISEDDYRTAGPPQRSVNRRSSILDTNVVRQLRFNPEENTPRRISRPNVRFEEFIEATEGINIDANIHPCNTNIFQTGNRVGPTPVGRRANLKNTGNNDVVVLANARAVERQGKRAHQAAAVPADKDNEYKCHNENHRTPMVFPCQESKELHVINEHRCPLFNKCKFSHEYDRMIRLHFEKVHEAEKQVSCPICDQRVAEEDLQSHTRNTHYKCSSCLNYFETEAIRDEHLRRCRSFTVPKHNELKPMLVGAEQFSFRPDQELEVASKNWIHFSRHLIDSALISDEEKRIGKELLEKKEAMEQLKRTQSRATILTNKNTIKQLIFVIPKFHTGELKDVSKSANMLLAGATPESKLTGDCKISPSKALENFYRIDSFTRKIRDYASNMPLTESQCKLVLNHFLATSIVSTIEGLSQSDYNELSYENILTYLQKIYCPISMEELESDLLQAKLGPNEGLIAFQNRIRRVVEICSGKLPTEEKENYKQFHLRRLTMENLPEDLKKEIKENELTSAQYSVNELAEAYIAFQQKEGERKAKKIGRQGEVNRIVKKKEVRKEGIAKSKSFGNVSQFMNPGGKREIRINKDDRSRKGREKVKEGNRSSSTKERRVRSRTPSQSRFRIRIRSRTRSRSQGRGRAGNFRSRRRSRSKSYEAREIRNNNPPATNVRNNNNSNSGNYNNNNKSRLPYSEQNRLRKEEFETKKRRLGEPWASKPKFCLRCSDEQHWADSPECSYDHTLPVSDNVCWRTDSTNRKLFCGYHLPVACQRAEKPKNVYWMNPKT